MIDAKSCCALICLDSLDCRLIIGISIEWKISLILSAVDLGIIFHLECTTSCDIYFTCGSSLGNPCCSRLPEIINHVQRHAKAFRNYSLSSWRSSISASSLFLLRFLLCGWREGDKVDVAVLCRLPGWGFESMKSSLEDVVFNIAFESLGRLLIPVTLLLFAFHTRS